MKVSIQSKDTEHICFTWHNTRLEQANALRCVLIAEIPCVAVAEVNILENTSVMPTDVLQHRLELIPLAMRDMSNLIPSEDCDCQSHCDKCSCTLDVLVENPREDVNIMMTSNDLFSRRPDLVRPVFFNPPIPIVKLGYTHKVRAQLIARGGVASWNHSKFKTTSLVKMTQPAILTLNPDVAPMSLQEAQEVKNSCIRNVFDIEDSKLCVRDSSKCTMCMECKPAFRNAQATTRPILIEVDPHTFMFEVESIGQWLPEDIVLTGIRVLKEKLEALALDLDAM